MIRVLTQATQQHQIATATVKPLLRPTQFQARDDASQLTTHNSQQIQPSSYPLPVFQRQSLTRSRSFSHQAPHRRHDRPTSVRSILDGYCLSPIEIHQLLENTQQIQWLNPLDPVCGTVVARANVERIGSLCGGKLNWLEELDCIDHKGAPLYSNPVFPVCHTVVASAKVERISSFPGGKLNWLEELECNTHRGSPSMLPDSTATILAV
eukprot:gene31847-7053_t